MTPEILLWESVSLGTLIIYLVVRFCGSYILSFCLTLAWDPKDSRFFIDFFCFVFFCHGILRSWTLKFGFVMTSWRSQILTK